MADRRGRKRVLYQHGATATARFALLYKQNDSVDIDEDFDGGRIIDNEGESNRNKFFGNLAVLMNNCPQYLIV